MLQRKQTIFILISFILSVVCLCNPLGRYMSDGEHLYNIFNLWIVDVSSHQHAFTPWVALFVIQVLVATLTFFDIMLFTRRALQMRILVFCMLLQVGYYLAFAYFVWHGIHVYAADNVALSFKPSLFLALPFITIVFDYFAFRLIMKDDMLVRSLDRLR